MTANPAPPGEGDVDEAVDVVGPAVQEEDWGTVGRAGLGVSSR